MDDISSYIKWRYCKAYCILKTEAEDFVESLN
jgi:hypothetical protein